MSKKRKHLKYNILKAISEELKMPIDSYVYQYLKQENQEIIDEFNLQVFTMNVQSIERTFIDKVFALCDYYMQGKSHRYSRHLYDLVKLRPLIKFDADFAELVQKVREHRKEMSICPSAKDGIVIPSLIKEFCEKDFYKKDYEEITYYFMNSPLDYSNTITNIQEISNSGLF